MTPCALGCSIVQNSKKYAKISNSVVIFIKINKNKGKCLTSKQNNDKIKIHRAENQAQNLMKNFQKNFKKGIDKVEVW